MEKLKVSVCAVVLNEEKTIQALLDSLLNQTKKPDEIILIDGGSKDKTVKIIKSFQKKYPFIKLFVKKTSIPQARNLAVKKAKGEIILFIDAGCKAKKDWLEKMLNCFQKDKNAMIVAGAYEMKAKTPLQKAFSLFVGVQRQNFKEKNFVPSTRSVAFKKDLWEKLNGFNESLQKAEDTEFFLKAEKIGAKKILCPEAKVIWFEFENLKLKDMIKKFFSYAKEDAKTLIFWNKNKGIKTHNLKVLSIFARYSVCFLIFLNSKILGILIFLFYLIWAFFKFHYLNLSLKERLSLIVMQIISDFSVMIGFLVGILEKVFKNERT